MTVHCASEERGWESSKSSELASESACPGPSVTGVQVGGVHVWLWFAVVHVVCMLCFIYCFSGEENIILWLQIQASLLKSHFVILMK